MNVDTLIERSRPFLSWIVDWQSAVKPVSLRDLVAAHGPDQVGIVSVDVIKGFCSVGPLASPRVGAIIEPITALFQDAWAHGIRNIALTQDAHPNDAVEFASYAPHCIRGTVEAETVDAFTTLPFFDSIEVFEKNSINSALAPGFQDWLDSRPHVKTWIAVGDCTDLCTYQLAMHLRLTANQAQKSEARVIVPVNAVDTYDLPVETAREIGAVPHSGDLLHSIYLYSMMLNGIEVVREVTP